MGVHGNLCGFYPLFCADLTIRNRENLHTVYQYYNHWLIVLVSSTAFTYHVIILLTFPIVVASMYDEMRLRKYAFWLTVFCIVVSTYAGYYWGICDANMVLITCTSYRHLVQDGTFLLTKVNESPVITLFLYYVLPRSFTTFCFQYLCNKVNYVVRKSLENAVQMEYKALTDDMTGAYNKNRLIELLNNRERDGQDIAVIYWDVNQLKYVRQLGTSVRGPPDHGGC